MAVTRFNIVPNIFHNNTFEVKYISIYKAELQKGLEIVEFEREFWRDKFDNKNFARKELLPSYKEKHFSNFQNFFFFWNGKNEKIK